ncbi:hypothetical protein NXV98_12660 [Bacteroides fragilis]|nr:hypothetical protein NXV98_12660 [Bacteroides fragilis]
MIDYMKNLFVGLLTGLAAYLNPISGDIKSLVALFFFNFLFGLAAGLLANNESFSLKKAFRCIIEAMVFFSARSRYLLYRRSQRKSGRGLTMRIVYNLLNILFLWREYSTQFETNGYARNCIL